MHHTSSMNGGISRSRICRGYRREPIGSS